MCFLFVRGVGRVCVYLRACVNKRPATAKCDIDIYTHG